VTKFVVVFETALYRSLVVEAEDRDEAANKAVDAFLPAPEIPLPTGYEVNDGWFVEDVVKAVDDD